MKETILLSSSDADLRKAANIIVNGGLVVFPTETVYGLGADSRNNTAVTSIFTAKGRPQDNPLIVHIKDSNPNTLQKVATDIPKTAIILLREFSPGPLTIVLKRNPAIPPVVSANLQTIAIRIPSHPIARKLIEYSNAPIAAPSANISGRPSPTTFAMAKADMFGKVDAIIDGGECHHGLESTVISFEDDMVHILRPGAITAEMIKSATGLDSVYSTHERNVSASPGTRYAHYKPNAIVRLSEKIDINRLIDEYPNQKIAVILYKKSYLKNSSDNIIIKNFNLIEDYARDLYKTFVEFEEANVDMIIAETVPKAGLGVALMNRLERAGEA